MNKIFKWILFSLIILAVIAVVYFLFLKIKYSDAKVTFCEVDSDCVIVNSINECCEYQSVNLSSQDYFVNKFNKKACEKIYCVSNLVPILPECSNNKCQIKLFSE